MTVARAEAYRNIVNYTGKMLPEWRHRIQQIEKRNRYIAEAKKRYYDSNANRQVQEAFKNHTAKRRDWGYGEMDRKFSQDFQEMLKNPHVDPNVKLTDSTHSRYSGVALHAVSSGRIYGLDKLHEILCSRYADPITLNNAAFSDYNFTPVIINYGLPLKAAERAMTYYFTRNNMYPTLLNVARTLFFDGGKFTVEHLKAAVRYNNVELVTLILASGMDCNKQDKSGETALFTACRIPDNTPVKRLLLAAGCDQSITNNAGKNAEAYTNVAKFVKYFQQGKNAECRIMLSEGVDPNTQLANCNTLLIEAVEKGDLGMVKMLLSYNADVNLKDSNGYGALATAFSKLTRYRSALNKGDSRRINKNSMEIVKSLVRAGADVSQNPRGFGGKPLNFIYYLISRCNPNNIDMYAELLDFMLDYTDNFTYDHWRNIPGVTKRLPEKFPARVKDKLLRKIPEDLRNK